MLGMSKNANFVVLGWQIGVKLCYRWYRSLVLKKKMFYYGRF